MEMYKQHQGIAKLHPADIIDNQGSKQKQLPMIFEDIGIYIQ